MRRGNVSLSYTLSAELNRVRAEERYESLYKTTSTSSWSRDELHNSEKQIGNRLGLSWQLDPRQTLATSLSHWGTFGEPTNYISTNTGASYTRSMDRDNHRLQAVASYTNNLSESTTLAVGADYLFRKHKQIYLEQLPGVPTSSLWQYTHMYRLKPSLSLRPNQRHSYSVGLDFRFLRQHERTEGITPTQVEEVLPAIYGTYAGQIGSRLKVQAGLRLQYTHASVERGVSYGYHHLGVLPSLSMMYVLDPKRRHAVSLQAQRSGRGRYRPPQHLRVLADNVARAQSTVRTYESLPRP